MDVMKIEKPESLLTWASACDSQIHMDEVSAGILIDCCEGRGFHIGTDTEGRLYLSGKLVDTQMDLDDVIDLVCDWLYEDKQVARDKMEQTTDISEYSQWSMDLDCISEMQNEMNRLFNQTKYGRAISEAASKVADSVYQRLTYVPVYNIPVVDVPDMEENHLAPQPEIQKPAMQVAEPKTYEQTSDQSQEKLQMDEKVAEKRIHEPLPFEPTENSRVEDEYVNPFHVVGEYASTEPDFRDDTPELEDKTIEVSESSKSSDEVFMQEAYMPERRGR